MTTPNTLPANGLVSDAEVDTFCEAAHLKLSKNQKYDLRRALEAFAQSRQPSAQGSGVVSMEHALSILNGILVAAKEGRLADPEYATGYVEGYIDTLNECATPPAGGGKEALSDAERLDFVMSAIVADEAKIIDILHDEEGFPLSRERMIENINAAIRAGRKG